MTLTITLDPETEAQLSARAEKMGTDAATTATLLLTDLLHAERIDLEAEMTAEEWAAIEAGIQRGEADFAEGRFRSLEAIIADKAARFGVRVDA